MNVASQTPNTMVHWMCMAKEGVSLCQQCYQSCITKNKKNWLRVVLMSQKNGHQAERLQRVITWLVFVKELGLLALESIYLHTVSAMYDNANARTTKLGSYLI